MLVERIQISKKKLIGFAFFIESMIEKSVKGLLKKQKELLVEIIEHDEPKTNQMELGLEEYCTNLIAQFEPKAKDLRTILMIVKISNDLERMGDLAENFCRHSIFLIERPALEPMTHIEQMAEVTISMLKDSITAFINEDVNLAESICKKDKIVDGFKDRITMELIPIMSADPNTIERAIRIIKLTRHIERIADLSTNICEDIVYLVEGRIIKHYGKDK